MGTGNGNFQAYTDRLLSVWDESIEREACFSEVNHLQIRSVEQLAEFGTSNSKCLFGPTTTEATAKSASRINRNLDVIFVVLPL
jgi:hypothetical protein